MINQKFVIQELNRKGGVRFGDDRSIYKYYSRYAKKALNDLDKFQLSQSWKDVRNSIEIGSENNKMKRASQIFNETKKAIEKAALGLKAIVAEFETLAQGK